MPKKILVAYYSHSGNTRSLAEMIARAAGGDLMEIVPRSAYPADYDAVVAQAKEEIRRGDRPEIEDAGVDVAGYDAVLVGSPNWWSTVAPPVGTFLAGYDFAGKTVVPFVTHGGGGMARCAADVAALTKGATGAPGFAAYGDSAGQADVDRWLKQVFPD